MPSEAAVPAPGQPIRRELGPTLRKHADALICVGLVLASLLVGIVQVPKHSMVSPIDEYVYIDAVAKVPTQLVVRQGEEVGDFARRYLACHSVRLIGIYPESLCAAPTTDDDAEYPNEGRTTADIYVPLYFATTWLLAQPLTWFGVDLVDAGRSVGALWLALAAVALFLALRRLAIPRALAAALPVLLVGSLAAYWSNTYISTDATALAAGSVLLLTAVRVREGSASPWWFGALSVLFVLFKLQNIVAVLAVGLFLMLCAIREVRGAERPVSAWLRHRWVWASALTVVVAALAQIGWVVLRRVLAVDLGVRQGVDSDLSATAIAREFFKFLPGAATGASAPEALGLAAVFIGGVTALLVVGGVIGVIGARRGLSAASNLGVATLVVSALSAPILALVTVIVAGEFVPLVPRYGMSIVPIAFACVALLFQRRRWVQVPLLVLSLVLFAASLTIEG
ncbi:hypothetical protein [Antiquaquibacter soli]|uniref:DUF2142 domain-containing protein n=1 Tax=Antiquaquibacter soli TaxID=3064523 RepID=A0ABT9BPC3_9MICO|nr:hypothetical protein [Protaetiibacter sp. WY-16]MDO7881142.1 hypothetical protein [Protaetiibacter sp. WY-16]